MKVLAVVALALAAFVVLFQHEEARKIDLGATPIIPHQYPLYMQCDPRWANNFMGGNSTPFDTVCAQGCAMSSLAMALNGRNYTMPNGSAPTPGTLNNWLRYNNGYHCIGKSTIIEKEKNDQYIDSHT